MTRRHRSVSTSAFDTATFDEQLVSALRGAPWWMISVALHLVVVLILSLIPTTRPKPVPKPDLEIGDVTPIEEPAPEEPPTTHTHDPTPVDTNLSEPNPSMEEPNEDTRDTDQELSEAFGNDSGPTVGDLEGPSRNSVIGTLGGASGGPFGRGGMGDGRSGKRGTPRDKTTERGLEWLKAHQSPSGAWETRGFGRWCNGALAETPSPDGAGKPMYDTGATGLALCTYLGAGYTNRGRHPYRRTVSRGLRYLKNTQDPEGCFGSRAAPTFIYNHATASLAMVEAYGMTGSALYKPSAQRALDFIGLSRNPYYAWRYGVKPGNNDTSVSGWMMMAVKSAKLTNADALAGGREAPLAIDDDAFDGIGSWLDKMTDPDTGRVGYMTRGSGSARPRELVDRFPTEKSEAMTAVGVLARIFMGEDPRKSQEIRMGADLMRRLPPTWNTEDGSIDMYYWYYGALAMHQVGGKHWATWSEALDQAVIQSQRTDGTYCEYKGSWDPVGPWGEDGGRVYSTALMTMCMQVYYRYDRVFGTR